MSRLPDAIARSLAIFAILAGLAVVVPLGWALELLSLGATAVAERLRDAYRALWTNPLRPAGR